MGPVPWDSGTSKSKRRASEAAGNRLAVFGLGAFQGQSFLQLSLQGVGDGFGAKRCNLPGVSSA